MNKKIIIILAIVILLSLTAGTILLVGKKSSVKTSAPANSGEIKKLLDEPVVSPVGSFDGSAIWYFASNSRLFRINTDGSGLTEFPLPSVPTVGNLSRVLWPQTGSDFIAFVSTSLGEVKNYYDSAQNKYIQLPENVQSVDWMPDSKRIIYVWKAGDAQQQLKIAASDSSGFSTVADVFWPDYVVKASPDGDSALLYRSNPEGSVNKIYKVNLKTKQFETVIETGKNSAAAWLPGGEKFLFVESSTATPHLFMYNFSNRQITDLNLAVGVDKVALDSEGKILYAAVAKKDNPPAGGKDEFIKLDLMSLKQEFYYQPQENLRAKSLLEIKGRLYFVNLQDNKLYYIAK